MKRWICVSFAVLSMLLIVANSAAAAPGGNSANAKQCQKGGWETRARQDRASVAFTSQDACVSYAAQGGTIVRHVPSVAPTQTSTPLPTSTPVPTQTPLPTEVPSTSTPIPTQTPLPTSTPVPEDAAVTRCRQEATALGLDGNAFATVIVGSDGNDSFDYVYIAPGALACGFGGADSVYSLAEGAVFLGGDGDDFITHVDGGTFYGGAGNDFVSQCYPPGTFDGGAGFDAVQYNMGCNVSQVEDDGY